MTSRQEYNRQYYLAHREQQIAYARQNYRKNIPRERARTRRRRLEGYKNPKYIRRDEIKQEFWCDQDGRCYLCGDVLASLETAHLDHDHRCCPYHDFCRHCVRGLSCPPCNYIIGNAGDDPDRLELIARNLRVKLAEMDERLASKPVQRTLDDALLD
jgi:hypothetical protein